MALIDCPECNKKISDKAMTCPNCGYPISENHVETFNMQNDIDELICPKFPEDLSLEKFKFNPFYQNVIFSHYDESINNIQGFESGNVIIEICKNGIEINRTKNNLLHIHKSQIISLHEITREELITKKKSIIGRAIVGGVLAGGIGAIVGAISGVGKNEATVNKYYLVINYWEVDTRKPNSIIVSSKKSYKRFIDIFNKDVMMLEI